MKIKKLDWLLLVLIPTLLVLLQGCSSSCQREPQVAVKTIFTEAKPVHIVVNTEPYAITDEALSSLRSFFSDSLGLETEVSRIDLEGVTKSDSNLVDIFNAAIPVLKEAQAPTLVLFSVQSIRDFHGGGNFTGGERIDESGQRCPVGVVVLERPWFSRKPIESYLLKHEVGHWVGIPARECHALRNNRAHCSSMRCTLMPGPGSAPLRCAGSLALSLLFLSLPDFCDDCQQELAAMKKLHLQMQAE